MTQSARTGRGAARRTVVVAAGATGLTAAIAACGDSGSDSDDGNDPSGGANEGEENQDDQGEQEEQGDDEQPEAGPESEEIAKAADIPEGGGKIFKDEKVVVTQPKQGEFKAFSAVCTHQGCLVSDVADGTINCSCHGSKFALADGSVQDGPATAPLQAADVQVDGDSVRLR